jgi:hypothetical protein
MMEKKLFDTSPFGDFYVPSDIVRFLVALTAPQPGEKVLGIGVIDPQVLRSAVESAVDIQPTYVRGQPTLKELDSLDINYSVILCAPPFGLSFSQDPAMPGEPSEEFWLKWSVGHLSQDGRLAIVVPAGLLSNYSQQSIRHFLLGESGLQAILELPAGWAQGTATQASILFITSNNEPDRLVRMFRFTSVETIPWHDLAPHVRATEPDRHPVTLWKEYAVAAAELKPLRLDAQYYDPKYTQIPVPDPNVFEAVNLADLVEIRSGQRFSKGDFQSLGIPFIQVGRVTVDGHLNLRNARAVAPAAATASRGHGQPGDVLVTVAGTVGKVAFLGDDTPPNGVCIDTSLRRLRVLDDDRLLPEYLALYLRSRLAQLQIERFLSGSVIRTLSSPNLGSIAVYLPDLPSQREIVAAFHGLSYQQTAGLLSAFPDVDRMRSTTGPSELPQTQIVEQITLPLTAPETPSWQEVVKTQFPFPIARAYTVFEDRASHSPSSRLKALIDVSEAVVYYLYGVLAADYLRRLMADDDDPRSKIVTNYSIDRRIQFILNMRKLAKEDPNIALFVPELDGAEVGVCSDIHNNLRNQYSHVAAPPEPWCEQAIANYEPKLERLLQSLMPLQDYKLAQVTGLTVRDSRPQHTVILMMGNNPLFQSQVEDLESLLPADTNHVILLDQDYNVLDLHPFFLLHAWESTGMYHHLCFFKQTVGDLPNQRLRVESTQGVGDTTAETDLGLNALLTTV